MNDVIEKESEIENESDKEMSVFTNQYASCPHFVSSFHVSKGLFDESQLHYSTFERQFTLINKGKIENDINP